MKIVLNVFPFQDQGRPPLGTVTRDPIAEVFVRVLLGLLNLAQKHFRAFHLLEPAILRRVPGLLVFQLFHCGMAVTLTHPRFPRLAPARSAPPYIRDYSSVKLTYFPSVKSDSPKHERLAVPDAVREAEDPENRARVPFLLLRTKSDFGSLT